jgi:hypothetical protein
VRTPEQINNLRRVLCGIHGPVMLFTTDQEIDAWANRLQHHVDSIGYLWEVRIRTDENRELEWSQIEKEPTSPRYSVDVISHACNKLIDKYPRIIGIKITDAELPTHSYIFDRTGKGPYRVY